jgi:hypothetical protein
MASYRIYRMTSHGRILDRPDETQFPDDEAVVRHVSALHRVTQVEIWDRERLVARLSPSPRDGPDETAV